MKFKRKDFMKKLTAGATMAVMMASSPLTVFAAESESGSATYDYNWIGNGGNNTFDDLTTTVQQTGASFYKLLMAVGVIGLIAVIIVCGIKLAAAGSGKRADAIEQLIWVFIGGIIVFGAVSIIGFMGAIGANL